MKREFYPSVFLFFLFTAGSIQRSVAQCNCSAGVPATAITYYYFLDTTDAASTIISFPKFDPSIGSLNCIVFNDTLTGVSTTGVKNLSSFPVTYKFLLSIANDISGPGINVNESFSKVYGPSSLTAKGTLGDSTTYGPDTIFNHSAHQTTTSAVGSYLGGSGTVDFVYTLNGGLISTQGGVNYNSHIETRYWGAFRLTYYWCPGTLLAAGLRNFYVARNKNELRLVWDVNNENPENTYSIEYSKDGKNFSEIGRVPANKLASGYAKYKFNVVAKDDEEGFRSFRIKQVEPSGLARYSPVQTVLLEHDNLLSFQASPNPATKMVNLFFYTPTSGNFEVQIVNLSGQVLFRKEYRIKDQYSIHVAWAEKMSGGLYFLKVQDKSRQLQKITKLLIN